MATKTKTRKTSVAPSPKRFPRIVIPNLDNFEDRGWKIYGELRSKLEKKHLGKIVAIDVESKDYFVGDDVEDAGELAHVKHPGKLLFYTRIGGENYGSCMVIEHTSKLGYSGWGALFR